MRSRARPPNARRCRRLLIEVQCRGDVVRGKRPRPGRRAVPVVAFVQSPAAKPQNICGRQSRECRQDATKRARVVRPKGGAAEANASSRPPAGEPSEHDCRQQRVQPVKPQRRCSEASIPAKPREERPSTSTPRQKPLASTREAGQAFYLRCRSRQPLPQHEEAHAYAVDGAAVVAAVAARPRQVLRENVLPGSHVAGRPLPTPAPQRAKADVEEGPTHKPSEVRRGSLRVHSPEEYIRRQRRRQVACRRKNLFACRLPALRARPRP